MAIDKTKLHDLYNDEPGTVYYSGEIDGVKYMVTRGGFSICAYLGVPVDHPIANRDYNDIDLAVHGGLTFGQAGDGVVWATGPLWPVGSFWYGWDYGHYGDKHMFPKKIKIDLDKLKFAGGTFYPEEHLWTPEEVLEEIKIAIPAFVELMKQYESQEATNG